MFEVACSCFLKLSFCEEDARLAAEEDAEENASIAVAGEQSVPFGFETTGEYKLLMAERATRRDLKTQAAGEGDPPPLAPSAGPPAPGSSDGWGGAIEESDADTEPYEEMVEGESAHTWLTGDSPNDEQDPDEALREESAQIWGDRYWEDQSEAMCGQHALNNLIGCPQYQLPDFVQTVIEIVASTGDDASQHMNAQGWYSHGVLGEILQKTNPPQWRLSNRRASIAQWDALMSSDTILGALVNKENKHWVSICKHKGHVFYCDSRYLPHIIDADDWSNLLHMHPDTYFVIAHDSDWDQ